PGCQFRSEVARLVRMGQEHLCRRQLPHDSLQNGGEAVGGVRFERRVLDRQDFGGLRGSGGGPHTRGVRARDEDGGRRSWSLGPPLRADDRLPRGAIEFAVALLGNDENHAMTRASSRSFRTSSFAASAGDPSMSWVFLPFSGT